MTKIITLAFNPSPEGGKLKKNSLHSSLKRKAAFTLAEVLVTLGIIGVVSAMPLPTLISNHRNKVLEAQFKKEYSFIMQTVDTFLQRTSCAEAFCIKSDNFIKEFEKFTKFVHKCTPTSIDEKLCFTRINDCSYTDLQRKLDCVRVQVLDDYQYVLPDGALITFNNTTIGVDVNGKTKRPNAIGQDVFLFELKAENFSVKLVPWGAEGTPSQECQITGRTSAYNGEGCAYRALTEADYFKKLP